ncbi:MAG: 1-deoxy-D-xylulose 5-phosphate reductoisomerase [candidate division NC10 bacterium]|nr:1-deoxy-D-xylulose 5-phosphate reductoisomerase [candidate division NC10 bacterium]
MRQKQIVVLGSTGSIGRSTLEVIEHHADRCRVIGLSAGRNIALLREQIARFRPLAVAVQREEDARVVRSFADGTTTVLAGEDGLVELATHPEANLVVSALVGFAGLVPTYRAILAGKDIALANKETLVIGGELIMQAARAHGVRLLPVDSEHSAILQCLQGEDPASVERLLLTASGGPFRTATAEQLAQATCDQALRHPTWSMGSKITIDSATLMNKGLEVIEAHWLFGVPAEHIAVVIHPQSIIHSLVEFADGSVKAQLGVPDMKLPIQYALFFPERPGAQFKRLDLAAMKQLTFHEPDGERFRCLPLAYRSLALGGTAPAVLNAANEVAVQLFLDRRIAFPAIADIIADELASHTPLTSYTMDDLVRIDRATRESVLQQFSAVP